MIIRTTLLLFTFILAAGATRVVAQVRPSPTPVRQPATAQTPAQTGADVPVPPSRIALIDTGMFADEKRGIYRYVDAVKSIQPQFAGPNQELINLQNRINTLVEEIRKLRAAPQPDQRLIQAKQEEGTRIQQDFNTKKQRFSEDFEKKLQEVTGPVSELIGKAMDEFARARGITMTLDLSKLLPAMLTALPAVDVTDAFIADFNRKNPRTGAPPKP
jgi:Skp family chaperone for outer membrane proteins